MSDSFILQCAFGFTCCNRRQPSFNDTSERYCRGTPVLCSILANCPLPTANYPNGMRNKVCSTHTGKYLRYGELQGVLSGG